MKKTVLLIALVLTLVFVACTQPKYYMISLEDPYGINSTESYLEGSSFSLPDGNDTASTIFKYWVDATGSIYQPGEVITVNSDYQFKAVRTNNYEIVIDKGKGYSLEERYAEDGSSFTFPDAPAGIGGSIFCGWSVDGTIYNPGDTITVSSSIRVTATWDLYPTSVRITTRDIVDGIKGSTIYLEAEVLPVNAIYKEVKWNSENTEVASVSVEGVVTINSESGTSRISVSSTYDDKLVDYIDITARKPIISIVNGESTLNDSVSVGEKITIEYLSSKVSKDGSYITGFTINGTEYKEYSIDGDITVTPIWYTPITGLSFNSDSKDIHIQAEKSNTYQLKWSVLPNTATEQGVTFNSSDPSVASVDSNGLVTAKKSGSTVITMTSQSNPSLYDTCNIKVSHGVAYISVNSKNITLKGSQGKTATLKWTVNPSNADDPSVTITSSDESIATVTQDGVITSVNSGEVVITIQSNSNPAAVCKVNVSVQLAVNYIYLTDKSVTLNNVENPSMTHQLVVYTNPENGYKGAKWTSSDSSIVEVDSNGLITGKSSGKATITATSTYNTTTSAKCEVTVEFVATGAEFPVNNTLMVVDPDVDWYVSEMMTVYPLGATISKMGATIISSDESVIKPGISGVVNCIAPGTAELTVTTEEGFKSSINVTVVPKAAVGGLIAYDRAIDSPDLDYPEYVYDDASGTLKASGGSDWRYLVYDVDHNTITQNVKGALEYNNPGDYVKTGFDVGSGKDNTEKVISYYKNSRYGLSRVPGFNALYSFNMEGSNINTTGFFDWFIPSSGELYRIYNSNYSRISHYTSGYMSDLWTSSQYEYNTAPMLNHTTKTLYSKNKNSSGIFSYARYL